jgi:hypothetical protein
MVQCLFATAATFLFLASMCDAVPDVSGIAKRSYYVDTATVTVTRTSGNTYQVWPNEVPVAPPPLLPPPSALSGVAPVWLAAPLRLRKLSTPLPSPGSVAPAVLARAGPQGFRCSKWAR